jgi:tetratricopeptide (TPR) repeat protein
MISWKKIIAILFIMILISWQSIAQIDYLGQKPPGMKAEIFAPGIVSTNLYEHSAPAFSPDGKLVLWTVVDPAFHAYLLEMKYENGKWSKPARPSFSDSTADDYYPSFSPDGKKLYFSSRRKLPKGYPEKNNIRIWEIERNKSGWGIPLLFDTTVAKGEDYAHSIAANGNFYFSSSVGGAANFGILKSERTKGKNTPPALLPFNINSVGYDDGPFIAPDESFLIFESDRPEAFVGLYISFKQEDGSWGIPVNMGPEINSGMGERFGRVSPEGKYFFFGSARDTSGGRVGADIYWIDAKIITELRKQEKAKQKIQQPLGDELIKALDENDTVNSAGLLKQWLDLYPNSLDAIVIYSSVLRKQKRYADLEKIFNSMGAAWSGNASVVIEKALVKFGLDKNKEAEVLLLPVTTTGEQMRQRYFYLSEALLDMQKFDQSDAYFEKAMAINEHAGFWYNRACGYTHIGQKNRAFAALDKALSLGFNNRKQYTEDTDLIPLHTDKRWQQLLLRLK